MGQAHTDTHTNLDCFLRDVDLDVDRRGEEVELFWCLDAVLTGEKETSSSSEPAEQSDPSGPVLGSLEPDLDLETSRSLDELVRALCSLSWLGESI